VGKGQEEESFESELKYTRPSNPHTEYISEGKEIGKLRHVLTVAPFTTVQGGNQLNNSSVYQQMNGSRKSGMIHNGIVFGHKKNKVLSFSTTWMNLENIGDKARHTERQITHDLIYM
jgi:hypothetical protein